jgi:hypothetical protein
MSKENIFKNGGFPPILISKKDDNMNKVISKERFIASNVRNDINVRQLLTEKTKFNPIFIEDNKEKEKEKEKEELEVVDL